MNEKYRSIVKFIKELYNKEPVHLHEPVFLGNEKKYLQECIDTTYVSYVGEFVNRFEDKIEEYTKSKHAIAVVNGTTGLFISLKAIGVEVESEVITQPLTFVATANAIAHCGAHPCFVDVDMDTLGMSPESLEHFIKTYTYSKNGKIYNKITHRRISAILPVHVLGHPCRIDEIVNIACSYDIPVVEDAAEALGSFYRGKHCGTFGKIGVISFNGNKIITTGGGGMIITDDEGLALRIRHLITTAKVPHKWEYIHDEVGYNFRMPNINAAIGLAQMEYFDKILTAKRKLAEIYSDFFRVLDVDFFTEPVSAKSNYWLNTLIFNNKAERDSFLEFTHNNGVITRPVWKLINKLPMYRNCFYSSIDMSYSLEERLVNIPSSAFACL